MCVFTLIVINALHQVFLAFHFQAYGRIAFPSPLVVKWDHVTCSGQGFVSTMYVSQFWADQ